MGLFKVCVLLPIGIIFWTIAIVFVYGVISWVIDECKEYIRKRVK